MKAKKVLEALSKCGKGEFAKARKSRRNWFNSR
jgi:hypothetical protein